ncbi:MAG: methyltransferase family protein [Thermoproteota archaeon]
MAEILKRYLRDIREKGKPSDIIVLLLGGAIFFLGLIIAVTELMIVQRASYVFDFLGLSGVLLFIAGAVLRVQARRTLGELWSPVVRVLPEHELVTYGIYRHIRHPGYLGEMLMYISIPISLHSFYGFLIMMLIIPTVLYRVKVEEKTLVERFRDRYREYMKRTKRFIPRLL